MGENVNEIPPNEFFRAWTGNCFNIREDLFPFLLQGNAYDPYQGEGVKLWRNQEERDAILNHPGLTSGQQQQLKSKYADEQPITDDIVEVLQNNIDLFTKIGEVGLFTYVNFTRWALPFEPEHIGTTRAMMKYLLEDIGEAPEPAKSVFFSLKSFMHTDANKELFRIIANGYNTLVASYIGGDEDIYAGALKEEDYLSMKRQLAFEVIGLYLSYYMTLKHMGVDVPLAKGYHAGIERGAAGTWPNENTVIFAGYSVTRKRTDVGIYIHDEVGYGRNSVIGNLGEVYTTFSGTFKTSVHQFKAKIGERNNTPDTGSDLLLPTERQVTLYDVASDWLMQNSNKFSLAGNLQRTDDEGNISEEDLARLNAVNKPFYNHINFEREANNTLEVMADFKAKSDSYIIMCG